MSMTSNFAICEVISMFRRRFDTAQVKRSTLPLCRRIKDSQTLIVCARVFARVRAVCFVWLLAARRGSRLDRAGFLDVADFCILLVRAVEWPSGFLYYHREVSVFSYARTDDTGCCCDSPSAWEHL